MGFVVGILEDLLDDFSPERMGVRISLDIFFRINHSYAHGNGGLVMTCLEVKWVFETFRHDF